MSTFDHDHDEDDEDDEDVLFPAEASVEERMKDAVDRCDRYWNDRHEFVRQDEEVVREDAAVFAELLRDAVDQFCDVVDGTTDVARASDSGWSSFLWKDFTDRRVTEFRDADTVQKVRSLVPEARKIASSSRSQPLREFIVYGALVRALSGDFHEMFTATLWVPGLGYVVAMGSKFTEHYVERGEDVVLPESFRTL